MSTLLTLVILVPMFILGLVLILVAKLIDLVTFRVFNLQQLLKSGISKIQSGLERKLKECK